MAGAVTVRELLTTWGFDIETKPIDNMRKSVSDVKTAVVLMGAQAIAAGGTLFGFATSFANAGDKAAKTAAKLGVGVEALQEYGFAAELAGVSTQGFNISLQKFVRGIAEAKDGSGAAKDSLEKLSQLTGKDFINSTKPSEELLLDVADAFKGLNDETAKVGIAFDLFGASGVGMVNLLNQGSDAISAQRLEARQLGIVLSEDAAKSAEAFQDAMLRAESVLIGIRNVIGEEVAPVITDMLGLFKEWTIQNRELIKSNILSFVRSMIDTFQTVVFWVKRISTIISALITTFGGLENIIKAVSLAMTIFSSVKILSAIGQLAFAVGGLLTSAFVSLGNASLIANLKMLAGPVALGAAIVAMALLIDDFVAWVQGRPSLLGNFLGDFSDFDISEVFRGMKISFEEAFKDLNLIEVFQGAAIAFGEMFNLDFSSIATESGKQWVIAFLNSVTGGLGGTILDFFGSDDDEIEDKGIKKKSLSLRQSDLAGNSATLTGRSAVTPGATLAGSPSLGNSKSIVNNNNINVPVNVPAGTDPAQAQEMVRAGVNDAMSQMIRQTQAATSTAVER